MEPRMMTYGKGNVFAYRTFMAPLIGLKSIPESIFKGRDNTVFGVEITVEIGGAQFLPSFTEGDNSMVVATDSMKNFIQRHLGSYEGTTVEGFIYYVSYEFMRTYRHVDSIKMTGVALPFEGTFSGEEPLVFKRSRNEHAKAFIEMVQSDTDIVVTSQSSGIDDVQLVKVKDNSFVGFIRDEYTTLPEDGNRPLFIYLNIGWIYEHHSDATGDIPALYVAAEQVNDIASTVFQEVASPSIQSLIFQIGYRVLERFPQLTQVTFESQNRTWDTVVEAIPESEGKVYTEPRLPYGFQRFTVTRADLKKAVIQSSVNNEASP